MGRAGAARNLHLGNEAQSAVEGCAETRHAAGLEARDRTAVLALDRPAVLLEHFREVALLAKAARAAQDADTRKSQATQLRPQRRRRSRGGRRPPHLRADPGIEPREP